MDTRDASTAQVPPAPSTHRRAVITWVAIFPAVLGGQSILQPVTGDWPLVLRTLVLTLLVVPVAVYVLVPALMKANARITRPKAAQGEAADPAPRLCDSTRSR